MIDGNKSTGKRGKLFSVCIQRVKVHLPGVELRNSDVVIKRTVREKKSVSIMDVVMATAALPEDTFVCLASSFRLRSGTAGGTLLYTGKPARPVGWRL